MLQIDLPNIDNIKLWDEIVSNKRGIHKSNLLQCRHIVLERYVFYQSHYESLEEITPLDTQFWENIKEDLHSCYGNNVAFSRARKKLLSSAPKCPYCLLNRPNTLDHYFDKSDYTHDTAPWPPEKTKRVLEILPKPQEPVKKEPAAPKPQQVEDETAKPEAPPITEEAKPSSDAGTAPAAETPQETAPPPKRSLVPILVAVALVIIAGYALLNSHNQRAAWEQQYQTAAELFAGGNYKKAAELAEDVPKNIAEQPALLTVAKAGVLLNANTEESLRDGLDLLEYAWDLGSYSEQGTALQAELTARLQETLYEKAISLLHKGDAYAARDCLRELGNYKDAATILAYTHALIDSQSFNVILYRWALESLQAIPPDYNGEFAEEIAALRDALPGKIAEQEQIDAERAAILAQQQQQKPKPPQTFNYGGSTDTGPGSGHSLREDYGDPEDLYEDGGYDDLDEAWDEWEEGW